MPKGVYKRTPEMYECRRRKPQRKKCIGCDKEFYVTPDRKSYCSHKCFVKNILKTIGFQKGHPFYGDKKNLFFKKGHHYGNRFKKGHPKPKNAYAWSKGKKHPNWRGVNVGYQALHAWVKQHKGSPQICRHCGITHKQKRLHWANIDHKYHRKLNEYISLCVPCHRKYDFHLPKSILRLQSCK